MLATNKYIKNSSNRYACLLITEKIKNDLATKYSNWDDFLKFNPNLDIFLMNNSHINNILKNNDCSITDNDYQEIINKLHNLYIIKEDNIPSNTNNVVYLNSDTNNDNSNLELNKEKVKTLTKNHNSGFMDALLLAFIVGAFMGTAFINLYARILQMI